METYFVVQVREGLTPPPAWERVGSTQIVAATPLDGLEHLRRQPAVMDLRSGDVLLVWWRGGNERIIEIHRFVDDTFQRYDDEHEEKAKPYDLDLIQEVGLAIPAGLKAFDEAKLAGATSREAMRALFQARNEVDRRRRAESPANPSPDT